MDETRAQVLVLIKIKVMHKSLVVFHSTKYIGSKKLSVVKQFNDEQHEDNYIAYMKRQGYMLDEVYTIEN
jgi:hypothetical protein